MILLKVLHLDTFSKMADVAFKRFAFLRCRESFTVIALQQLQWLLLRIFGVDQHLIEHLT